MGKEVISDFLVRLGFDGKQVIKGVAQAEAALSRLKRVQATNAKAVKNVELDQAVAATKKRIQAESLVNRMKDKQANKDAVARRKEQAHLKRLLRAKAALRRTDGLTPGMSALTPRMQADLRKQLSLATNVEQVKNIRAEMGRMVKSSKALEASQARRLNMANALNFSMKGMVASLKNLARSWMSVFVVIGGAVAGLRVTQQFQALEASMTAVSESTQSAAENVEYIKELSKELPVNITKAGDQFKSMLASGREGLGQQGVQELFTALTEYGTALQLDPERMDRGMQAISQMLN